MKKGIYLLLGLSFITQCEEPIEVEVNDTSQRLVVEASINWIKETKQAEPSLDPLLQHRNPKQALKHFLD